MSKGIKIIQISDLHIDSEEISRKFQSARSNFIRITEELKKQDYDILILSGDLAENPAPETYTWILDHLKRLSHDFYLMSGNHDKADIMRKVFNLDKFFSQEKLFYLISPENLPIFLADTTENTLSQDQIDSLKKYCRKAFPKEILLFIHHPPVKCGCLFMDNNYPLKNWPEAWEELKSIPNLKHIFCGHYHTEKEFLKDAKRVYLTPSTKMQMRQDNANFEIDHLRPGYRKIFWDGTTLNTRVHFL